MDRIVQQKAAAAEELAAASEELNTQARRMSDLVTGLVALVEGLNQKTSRDPGAHRAVREGLSSTVQRLAKRPLIGGAVLHKKWGPIARERDIKSSRLLPLDKKPF
jgi:hypothetical protein